MLSLREELAAHELAEQLGAALVVIVEDIDEDRPDAPEIAATRMRAERDRLEATILDQHDLPSARRIVLEARRIMVETGRAARAAFEAQ